MSLSTPLKLSMESIPKCPLITERDKFPLWLSNFDLLTYALDVRDILFENAQPPPLRYHKVGIRKAQVPDAESVLERKTFGKSRRQALLYLIHALGSAHMDVFVGAQNDPFVAMENLKRKFGFTSNGPNESYHYSLSQFFDCTMAADGDIPTNLAAFITSLNTLAETTNSLAGKEVISDELKFRQLSLHCGPLRLWVQSTIVTWSDKSFAKLVAVLNDVMLLPNDQLKQIVGQNTSPNDSAVQSSTPHSEAPKVANFVHKKGGKGGNHGKGGNIPRNQHQNGGNNHYKGGKHHGFKKKGKGFYKGLRCRFCSEEGHDANHCPRLLSDADIRPKQKKSANCVTKTLLTNDYHDPTSPFIILDCGATDSHLTRREYFDYLDESAGVEEINTPTGKQ